MTTFIFSTALNSINSKKNSILNTFNNSPFSYLYSSNKWKDDKIINKLSELNIQTSTYNKMIPNVYGTVKLSGNVIWLSDVREVKSEYVNTIKTGKNSKINQSNVIYYYFIDVAIAICKGEIESINKVWADNELIDLNNFTYRIYYGTSTQEPDSLIQAVNGVGKTCAYRDICYIVFENFPLNDYGNRLPNFSFEVKRKKLFDENDESLLENNITGVNLIPACGEFVYSTIVQKKIKSFTDGYNEFNCNEFQKINENNNEGKSDCLVSLDRLKNDLPNCEWISVVTSWFCDGLDIYDCVIKPKVEYNFDGYDFVTSTTPDEWFVGEWNRNNAEIVSKDLNGNIIYGGTPSDTSIIELLTELKKRNYKISFNPMVFVDTNNKPWRGYITGNYNDVDSFFSRENGYNEFILHYANLVKDYVDVFCIGSELKGITKINDGNGNFNGVNNLINLARNVKNIVGSNVKVTYSADWSEYHHTDGGWYNLDSLWSSEYIDFVGIDAYFPLTNSEQKYITKQDIIDGWTSGEYYDYYFENNEKIDLQPEYAIKNINYWWSNYHINPDGQYTNWVPKDKKIWFMEFGFASVDGATNEPSKFYDPNSLDGGFPILSNGMSNFYYQRLAIEASLEVFENFEFLEEKFIWCWDARPYPYFPSLNKVWSDCELWKYGHWLNGKLGITYTKILIQQIFKDADLDINLIGDIQIDDVINGFVINTDSTVQEILNLLKKVYFFDFIEKDGKFNFISNKSSLIDKTKINSDDLIIKDNFNYINVSSIASYDLPNKVLINFIDINHNYDCTIVYSDRKNLCSDKVDMLTIPVVLDEITAKKISEIDLYLSWLEKNIFSFVLPIKYIFLEVGDFVELYHDNSVLNLKIIELDLVDNFIIEIKAVQFDENIYNTNYNYENENINVDILGNVGNTNLNIFELPAINNDMLNNPYVFFSLNSEEDNWKGANLYYLDKGLYKLIETKKENSIVGVLLNDLSYSRPYYFDLNNEINILFHSKIDNDLLCSISCNELYNQNNLALLGNEIIQFKDIVLNENGTYTLKNLLRGLFGTEKYINNHTKGDKFILLKDSELVKLKLDISNLQSNMYFKAVTIGNDLLETEGNDYLLMSKNLKPMSVCHIKKSVNDSNSTIIKWNRVDRGLQNWVDRIDSILSEVEEKYCVKFYDMSNNITNIYYTNKQEYIINNSELPYKISVCQVNNFYGEGEEKELVI